MKTDLEARRLQLLRALERVDRRIVRTNKRLTRLRRRLQFFAPAPIKA